MFFFSLSHVAGREKLKSICLSSSRPLPAQQPAGNSTKLITVAKFRSAILLGKLSEARSWLYRSLPSFFPSKEHTIVYKSYTPFAPLQIQAMSEIASNMFAFFLHVCKLVFQTFHRFLANAVHKSPKLDFKKTRMSAVFFYGKRATPPRFSKLLGFFAADVCCNVQNMVFFSKMVGKKLGEKKIDRR